MNGLMIEAETTPGPRRGLPVVLAAAVLLAASSGTAAAQNTSGVTLTEPTRNTVNEGGTATYTVAVEGYIAAATDDNGNGTIDADEVVAADVVTVTMQSYPDTDPPATSGDDGDLNRNAIVDTVTLQVPANSTTAGVKFTGSGTISVPTLHDNDAEDEHFELEFRLDDDGGLDTTADGDTTIGFPDGDDSGTDPDATYRGPLIIDDDETQGYALKLLTEKPREGSPVEVSLSASPRHQDGTGTLHLNIDRDAPGWSLATRNRDGNPADNPVAIGGLLENDVMTITIGNPASDGNRTPDRVTLTAHTGVVGNANLEASLTISVADVDALPTVAAKVVDQDGKILDPQPASLKEGETVKIAVMPLDDDGEQTAAGEDLAIVLAPGGPADARDYELSGAITITAGRNLSNVVDLTAETDDDVGVETLRLDATVSGEKANGAETRTVAGALSIDIEDATPAKVAPKPDADTTAAVAAALDAAAGGEGLNPGESFTLAADDLFTPPMDGYTVSIGATASPGGPVAVTITGGGIEVAAVKAGESTVTVTATAFESAASARGSQSTSNVAGVSFPVTVTDKALTLTLAAPAAPDGNVVEGMDYDITVTANRPVAEDTAVTFARTHDSEADVRDYRIADLTIPAGATAATATLTVTADTTAEAGPAHGEALHLYGTAGDTTTNTLELTIWDHAVPALPLIAQLLLAAALAAAGHRRRRRY